MPAQNISNLKIYDCFLYAIDSPKDAARRLNLELSDLTRLSNDAKNFRIFSVKPDGKKLRKVQEPKPELQSVHRRIIRLLSRVEIPSYLHSAARGRSYITNARAHSHRGGLLKIDVKNFYDSVSRANVFNFFVEQMKCRRDSAGILADLLTFDRHLATGSSASPIISFYAYRPMFDELEKYAITHSLIMTCYIDDLTFSGEAAAREMLWELRLIIRKYGLKSHKARFFKLSGPQIVTGVCITRDGLRVPYDLKQRIATSRRTLASVSSDEARARAVRTLIGRLDAAGQIEPTYRLHARQTRASYGELLGASASSSDEAKSAALEG